MVAPRRSLTQPRYAVALYGTSTAEQGHSGLGLQAQQSSVRAFVASQGWTLVAEHQDSASGKDDCRPGFQAALTRCRQPGAVLVAARLDRITRRAHTLSGLLKAGPEWLAYPCWPRPSLHGEPHPDSSGNRPIQT
jgi:hypothetical protein